jgi:hypothetical protein
MGFVGLGGRQVNPRDGDVLGGQQAINLEKGLL